MMILFLFAALLGCAALTTLLLSSRRPLEIGFRELGILVGFAYAYFFITALPAVWLDAWSVSAQVATALVWFIILCLMSRVRQVVFSRPKWVVQAPMLITFLLATAFGVFQQRHLIPHLYLTHDPGAYWNIAHHIARTGSFEYRNPLAAIAEHDHRLDAIVGDGVEAPEEWQQTKSYGMIPKENDRTRAGFHGFFGTPLSIAAGIQGFGDKNALAMNWIHLAALLLLLIACAEQLVSPRARGVEMLPLVFVSTPLLHPIFREALSEPLASVLFAAMFFFSMLGEREKVLSRVGFLLALGAGLCVRVSALIYVPFAVLFLFSATQRLHNGRQKSLVLAAAVVAILCAVTSFLISPAYLSDILTFYTKVASDKMGTLPLAGIAGAAAVLGLIGFRWFERRPVLWKWSYRAFIVLLFLGVVVRYARLVTKLDHNIGGYPFVLFNLDSLIFYGGPLVMILGFWYWGRRLLAPPTKLLFLQYFLPACVFFYWVYRFMPLNLQPNFQRYLLIEMIPLAVLGAVLMLSEVRNRKLVHGLYSIALVWNLGVLFAINHSDISRNGANFYQSVRNYLKTRVHQGERPVVVAVEPEWLDMAYLTPLAHGFGFPVGYVHFPFSARSREAIQALEEQGYNPILVSRREQIEVGKKRYRADITWKDCYRYPKFNLGAPPLELDERCNSFNFLLPDGKSVATSASDWKLALRDHDKVFPFDAKHWVGFEVPRACEDESRALSVTLLYPPAEKHAVVEVRVDAKKAAAIVHEQRFAGAGQRPAIQREIVVPFKGVKCGAQIDIYLNDKSATVVAARTRSFWPGEGSSRTASLH